jgi:CheY-like chemotaxis protein
MIATLIGTNSIPPIEMPDMATLSACARLRTNQRASSQVTGTFDVAAIAGALVRVSTDEAYRAELVAAGRARAAGLTWATTARRHVELWTSIE